MSHSACRANCLDASALVKIYIPEAGSDILCAYLEKESTKYTTPFCFYEALSTLKVMWLYRKKITKTQYLDASFDLSAWYSAATVRMKDLDLISPLTFDAAKRIVEKTSLDLSDAFQILSVKSGCFSSSIGDSSTVLVTGDKKLAAAARVEGLRAWYFMEEPAP